MGKSLLVLAAVLLSWNSNAQISYMDIVPDYFQSTSGEKEFDFNNDMISDLKFSLIILDPNADVWFNLATGDSIEVLTDPSQSNFLQQFDMGVSIPLSGSWKSSENLAVAYLTSGSPEGVWPGSLNKFFAFRMRKNGGYQYGWMQMSVHSKVNNYTLKDFAYQLTTGVAIHAGEFTNTGLAEPTSDNIFSTLYADGNLKLSFESECLETIMLDARGIEYKRVTGNYSELNLDVSDLPGGMYVVCVNTGSGYGFRKIVIP
jgi:hypothetical protein